MVPQSGKTKQVKVVTWIPKLVLGLLVIAVITTGYFTYDLYHSYNNLKFDYEDKYDKLQLLSQLNEDQKSEITTLETKIQDIEKKLESISKLEATVKNMVGIEEETTTEDKENNTQSSPNRSISSISREIGSTNQVSNNTENIINNLSSELDKSTEDLSNLIVDLEKKLEYLDAKPNLTPTIGRITSPYGWRPNPFGSGRDFHNGVDLANSVGTRVNAAGSGVVTYAGYNGGYGRVVVIKHGYGYESIYAHNYKLNVKVGDKVKKGDMIAKMGNTGKSTGPHLHFEIRYYVKTVDPLTVLNNNK